MWTTSDAEQFYQVRDPWQVQSRSPNNKRRENVIQSLSNLLQDKNVIELGCGEGHLSQMLARSCKRLLGLDISQTAINRAQERHIANASFIAGSMTDMAFYGSFDVAVVIEALYYLSAADQSTVLSAIKKMRATLIISAPIIGSNEHRIYYTKTELISLLTSHGFKVEQQRVLSLYWEVKAIDRIAIQSFKLLYLVLPAALMDPIYERLPERWAYQMLFVCR
jgi:2-polyprenyl-3-methyl-5-hydroxy-6-metoxy-1,4-benzoquinol methylase